MKSNEKRNTNWGIILSFISLGISLLGTLFITNRVLNYIGDYNYGLYSFVTSITAWLTVVSSALISSYLRFTSIEAKENDGDISKTNTIYLKMLSIIGGIFLVFGIGIIALLYFLQVPFTKYSWEDSKLIYLLFVFSIINISISLPFTIYTQFVNYKKQFIYEKILLIITTALQFAGHFILAYFTRNIIYIALYSIFSTLFNFVCNYVYCRKRLDIRFKKTLFTDNKPLIRSIIVFSSILVLNSIVDQININVDKTLLGFLATPNDVTIYQMGMQFNTYLGAFAIAISGVFAPKIHELCAKNDFGKVNDLFLKVSRMQAIVVSFIAFGFVACGYDFVLWWIGPSRIFAYYCGAILMVLNIMPLSVKVSIEIQRAVNKHKFRSFLYLAVAIINVGLSILFIHVFPIKYAIFACLLGTVISSIACQWIAMNVYNKKAIHLPIEKHLIQLGKNILYGIVGAGIVFLLRKFFFINIIPSNIIRCIVEGIIYIVLYAILMLCFERKFIMEFIKRKL